MTDSEPQKITSSGRKKVRRYSLESPPPKVNVSQNPAQVGCRYGRVRIKTAERRYNEKWSTCYVITRCVECGHETWSSLSNLTQRKTRGCDPCARRDRKHSDVPTWLSRRFTAAKQRCENPRDSNYKNYGARGIRFKFSTIAEACRYMIRHHGLHRELEIDRIDTDGHYEPGNLQYATREEQQRNRRDSVLTSAQLYWATFKSPYAYHTSVRLLKTLTEKEIIERANLAVRMKYKNWRRIQTRLRENTYMIS